MDNIENVYKLLDKIKVTDENKSLIDEISNLIISQNYVDALAKMRELKQLENEKINIKKNNVVTKTKSTDATNSYPKQLQAQELEQIYISLLLDNPKLISKYFFLYDICYFEDQELLNLYKSILFNEGSKYSSEAAKNRFNFSRDTEAAYQLKNKLLNEIQDKNYNMQDIYTKLKKIFILRKAYLEIPESSMQDKIIEITQYKLFSKMSPDEVSSTIDQVKVTQKFSQSVLSDDLYDFLASGESDLSNGLSYPFPILSSIFKGIRKGETFAYAMPSNYGKSRIATYLAAYTALIHKKKVLLISNEMSESKMKLCLITTIINNPQIQKLHGQKIHISETELLELKFKPDDNSLCETDENGYILRSSKEKQSDYIKRLLSLSSDFKKASIAINWASQQINNAIYFINITDHTNDELKKVITNYYYKEHIEYIFYDTLKPDTDNIGKPEEIKRTATILSNLSQNFNIFICSSLQLAENKTSPLNLDVNDLAVSRTVKEVLDTLCLFKQIDRNSLSNYEYSLNEVDTKFFDIEDSENPDIRYYSCVIDKNRAGAKPNLLFKINLAYNSWEELGYLKLKDAN